MLRPRSLAGQLALLVALALFAAQAINFALLLTERRARTLNQSVEPAITRLVAVAERAAAGEWRDEPLPFRPLRRVALTQRQRRPPGAAPEPAAEARLRTALADAGVPVTAVRALRVPRRRDAGREALVLAARLSDGRWVISRAPLPATPPGLVWRLLGETALIFLALLAAVLCIGRRAARPLAELTDAAARLGAQGRPQPVAERGPSDVRRLISAFNATGTRVAAMLREKDQMLGAIGHDLRTPLASLRLRAEGIADPGERQRAIETTDEMERTLDDILSLARIGRDAEPRELQDVAALAEAVVDDFHDLGANARFEPSPRLPVRLRPAPTRRALRNLVDNALKYGGTAIVRVRQEGADALVEVDDRGPGIPPERIEAMFEGFARLEGSRSRATGGSGLGLTLARAVARDAGGDVRLENLSGGGLRATLSLPL